MWKNIKKLEGKWVKLVLKGKGNEPMVVTGFLIHVNDGYLVETDPLKRLHFVRLERILEVHELSTVREEQKNG